MGPVPVVTETEPVLTHSYFQQPDMKGKCVEIEFFTLCVSIKEGDIFHKIGTSARRSSGQRSGSRHSGSQLLAIM